MTDIALLMALTALVVVGGLAAAGFILKRRAVEEFTSSLKADTPSTPHSAVQVSVSERGGGDGEKAPRMAGNEGKVKQRRRITKRIERKIIEMYKSGKSPKEIARVLGISTSTVYRRVRNSMERNATSTT